MPSLSSFDQPSLRISSMFEPRRSPFADDIIVRYPDSTAIIKAAYNLATATMWIWFPNNGPYTFSHVPRSEFDEMCSSDSPGTYYSQNIRGQYSEP